jgi:hypothetical protein
MMDLQARISLALAGFGFICAGAALLVLARAVQDLIDQVKRRPRR